jgi:hypothetical protein
MAVDRQGHSSVRAREGAPVGCIGAAQEKRWASLVGKVG